jgi:hypothetical protein
VCKGQAAVHARRRSGRRYPRAGGAAGIGKAHKDRAAQRPPLDRGVRMHTQRTRPLTQRFLLGTSTKAMRRPTLKLCSASSAMFWNALLRWWSLSTGHPVPAR